MLDYKEILSKDTIVQRTEEWFAIRETMLTASDVATAIGVNPFSSSKQLLINKRKTARETRFETDATRHGTSYEDEAIDRFCKKTGHKVHSVGIFVHPEHRWLGGSPDGLTETCELIEVKCPFKRKIEHHVPVYYYPQVQICMEILNIEACYFIQYRPIMQAGDDEILDIIKVDRSKHWFNEHLPVLKQFWDDVLTYRSDLSLSTALYGIEPNKIIDFSDISCDMHNNYAFIDDTEDTEDASFTIPILNNM